MKKINKYLSMLIFLFAAFLNMEAQQQPNRLLVVNQNGNYDGYNLKNIEQVAFRDIEGNVEAYVEVLSFGLEEVTIKVTRSFMCESFQFTIAPEFTVKNMNDLALISFVQNNGNGEFYDTDFQAGKITGISLKPGTKYWVITVGYDSLGTPVGVCKAEFETEAAEILGDPKVDFQIISQTATTFTVRYTPNEDVGCYYFMEFDEGTWEDYLEMFGPMFGCTTISELIEKWYMNFPPYTEAVTITYDTTKDDLYPGEIYDIVIAIKDKEGNFITPEIFQASTEIKGGKGEAVVNVELVEYKAEDWYGVMKPSQYIKFIPNDQTFRYRYTVQYKEDYDLYSEEEWREDLCQDPPQVGMAGYWSYNAEVNEYQCDTNTEFVVLVAAQNSEREWGPMTIYPFKTPETCPGLENTRSEAPAALKASKKDNVLKRLPSIKGARVPNLPNPALNLMIDLN